ncbi:MAG: glycosyltransferase family protein [Alteromonadaceae bacterium]|nr:glycosyltransferase family protein [Alteromonadaceae bacterium]
MNIAELKKLRAVTIDAHRAGRLEEAQKAYVSYLGHKPDDAQIWSNYGALLRTLKHYRNAERAQRRAYALDPKSLAVRGNLANILSDLGKFQESIELRQSILRENDNLPEHHSLIGRCLRGQGNYTQAVTYLEPLAARFPDFADIKMQLAMSLLALGRYKEAFQYYRARWDAGELTKRSVSIPEWNGEPLDGKTVVVVPEQGFGDCILMSRCLPALKQKGAAKVIVVAEKPLARLMANVEGADVVDTSYTINGTEDFWINMMDLGRLSLETDTDIPAPSRLTVPEDSRTRANEIVAPFKDKFKVGVVWTGSVTYRANAFRSFSHTDFLPLSEVDGVQLFSLYKGPMLDAFLQDGSGGLIVDAASTDRDFADCAAVMEEMDLIITSDTATAHIAGSLGLKTWTLLHKDAFWVYRHKGETTPWYPSMRLFRQKQTLHWDDVMEEVKAALVKEAAK